jgi:predicted nucleotidyltransferase
VSVWRHSRAFHRTGGADRQARPSRPCSSWRGGSSKSAPPLARTGHARLYLFGSRARGDAARASDIDIAILPDAPLEPGTMARIRDALEESTIPYEVEVIHLSSVDERFLRTVLAEAIAWNG